MSGGAQLFLSFSHVIVAHVFLRVDSSVWGRVVGTGLERGGEVRLAADPKIGCRVSGSVAGGVADPGGGAVLFECCLEEKSHSRAASLRRHSEAF